MALPRRTDQAGVSSSHVVKTPWETRYAFSPNRSIRLPLKKK